VSYGSIFVCAARAVWKEAIVARMSAEKRAELERFWRSLHEGCKNSPINRREYSELLALPLKQFGNWRARLKDEETVATASLLPSLPGGQSPPCPEPALRCFAT